MVQRAKTDIHRYTGCGSRGLGLTGRLFPEEEYIARLSRLRALGTRLGLRVLILFDDDRYIGGGGVRYFSGYKNSTTPLTPSAMVIAMSEPSRPSLVVAPGKKNCQIDLARRQSWLSDIRGTAVKTWGADYAGDIAELMERAGIQSGKIGVDSMPIMGPENIGKLRSRFPEAVFVDSSGLTEEVRKIKSKRETSIIRRAANLSDLGITKFMKSVKAGEYQYKAAAAAEYEAKVNGAEEAFTIMSGGTPYLWGTYRGDVRFKMGDMVAAEFNARLDGYFGQVCRTCVVGRPTDSQRDVYSATYETVQRMIRATKPGVQAGELTDIGIEVIKSRGYDFSGIRCGHGMGLTIAEPPDLLPGDSTVFEPGMYIMIHTSVFTKEGDACTILGDPVTVTSGGCKVLTKAKYELVSTRW